MANSTQERSRHNGNVLRRSSRLQVLDHEASFSHMEVEPTNKVTTVISSSPSDVTLLSEDMNQGKVGRRTVSTSCDSDSEISSSSSSPSSCADKTASSSSTYFSQEATLGNRYSVVESSWSERGTSVAAPSSTVSTHRHRKRLANIQNNNPYNKRALDGNHDKPKKRSRRRSPRLHNAADTTAVNATLSSKQPHSNKKQITMPTTSTVTPEITALTATTTTSSNLTTKQQKNITVQKDRRPLRILPRGVVDLYPTSLSCQRNCDCGLNHCSGASLSESFLSTYGLEYSEKLKLAEEQQQQQRSCKTTTASSSNNSFWKTSPSSTDHMNPEMEYMSRQPHLTPKMRAILMDWLIELAEEYKLHSTTLHLAATLVDQVLALKKKQRDEQPCISTAKNNKVESDFIVKREQLQCLGCSCMWIACKMEEIEPMSVDDFVYISDSSYNKEEIANMELSVCMSLQFHLQHITPVSFLHEYLRASQEESHMKTGATGTASSCCMAKIQHSLLEHMVLYLLELSLLPYELVTHKPSLVTAAAVYLARATLGLRDADGRIWSKSLQYYTGYDLIDLEETVMCLHKHQCEAEETELKSVFTKYSTPKYNRVSFKTALQSTDLGF